MQPDRAAFRLVLKWPNATEHSRRAPDSTCLLTHCLLMISNVSILGECRPRSLHFTCPVTTRADGFPGHQKI